jgi:hypothetical protein
MPDLHPAQFANQMALPGMEEHAHPWAGPLSKGYMLQHVSDHTASGPRHQLQAVDPKWPGSPDAYLEWGGHNANDQVEGEIHMIQNHVPRSEAGRGLGGALMRSAHHFDFGQDTVPVHSMNRTPDGKAFSDRVMPELKPTVWRNLHTQETTSEATGQRLRPSEALNVSWPGVHGELHPYQQRKAARDRVEIAKVHEDFAKRKQPRLF